MVDCGEGAQLQMRRSGIAMAKINHAFISHLHGDHFLGIFGLLSTLNLTGRQQPFYLHAPEGLLPMIRAVLRPDFSAWAFPIVLEPLDMKAPALVFEDDKVLVNSFPLRHSVPCCGFTFEEKPRPRNVRKDAVATMSLSVKEINHLKLGLDIERDGRVIKNADLTLEGRPIRKYAFVTDTLKCPDIVPYIVGADLLYHEATFLRADSALARKTFHTTAYEAAELASQANVNKLVIGHYSSRYNDIHVLEDEARQIFPNTVAATDGARFEVE